MLTVIAGAVGSGLVWGWLSGLWRSAPNASWRSSAGFLAVALLIALEIYLFAGLWFVPLLFFFAFVAALLFHFLWRCGLRRGLTAADHSH